MSTVDSAFCFGFVIAILLSLKKYYLNIILILKTNQNNILISAFNSFFAFLSPALISNTDNP